MDHSERLIPLRGSFNFRDLGGYPASPGWVTRRGRLFRADALHELTAEDVAILRELGLRTVVDLRTERELLRSGRGPLESEPVDFHHFAVVQEGVGGTVTADAESIAAPAPTGDDLAERYLWYLEVGRDALVAALTLFGRPERFPVVFHCAAGKDRTGVLAALVLEIAGVEPDVIVADYVVTAERIAPILERWRANPEFAERMASVPASRFSVEAVTMERFLEGLADRYGGARKWAESAGVPARSIDRMVAEILEPAG